MLCLAAHPSALAQQPPESVIVIRGSDTLGAKLIPQWAEGFKKAGAKVPFDIAAEGSSTAFTNLANKACRIGMSSRRITPTESDMLKKAGVQVQEIEVARDQIAIAVHPKNPISALTKQQVEKLFTGDILNWSEIGGSDMPVRIVTRNTSSGTYLDFKALAMNSRDYGSNLVRSWGEPPPEMIAAEPGSIGYVGMAYTRAKRIKVVPIDGVQPGQSASNPPYPYERPVYLYVASEATQQEHEFLEYIKSPLGNKILEVVGFLPPVTKP